MKSEANKNETTIPVGSGDLLGVMVFDIKYPNINKYLVHHTSAPITVMALLRCAASPERTETETGRAALERLLQTIEWHLGAINFDNRLHLQ